MKIYPVKNFTHNQKCNLYTQRNTPNFGQGISRKEFKDLGNRFVENSKTAKNRDEFYIIAKSYLKEGIIPIFEQPENQRESTNMLRQNIIDTIFADIELLFDPELIKLQEDLKHIGLKDERKDFINIVKKVNKIIRDWKTNNK